MQTDKNTVQETTVDVQSNLIEYDVRGADSEATIIDDYNRVGSAPMLGFLNPSKVYLCTRHCYTYPMLEKHNIYNSKLQARDCQHYTFGIYMFRPNRFVLFYALKQGFSRI